jgi:hypothetical protein
MAFAKISGGSAIPPALPISLAGGEYFMLPVGQGQSGTFGNVATPQLGTNNVLSGQYLLNLGQYSQLQVYDQSVQYWRNICVNPFGAVVINSADGFNYRVANTTGCPVGALVTTASSGLTNGFYGYTQFGVGGGAAITIQSGVVTAGNTVFTITPSAGGSLWNAIIGGAVNTTISITGTLYQNLANFYVAGAPSVTGSGGTGYTRPPIIVFYPPPNQGQQPYILPTAVCGISGGVINSVTVVNQGAGLLGLPGIVVIPQPGDTAGGGAVLGWTSGNGTQQGSGTLLAMWPAYYGTALTAVPTFTFSPSGAAATAIMNFTITSFTQGTPGVTYTAAGAAFGGGIVAGNAANTNPIYDKAISIPIFPPITVAATTGLPALAGPFGGVNIQAVPTIQSFSSGAAPGTAAVTTVNVGGANDTIQLMSI